MGGDGVKERLKAWWTGRPGLRRGRKLALNLALSAVLLALLWGLAGYPLPTAEMEFRRLERTNLMGRSEIVLVTPHDVNQWEGFSLFDRWCIGVRDGRAVVGKLQGKWSWLEAFPLEEGPSPVPLAGGHMVWIRSGSPHSASALLFIQIPEGTARGELAVDVTYQEEEYHQMAQGWAMDGGVWMFGVDMPEGAHSADWYQDAAYTLRLFDGADRLLLEQSGHIPQAE